MHKSNFAVDICLMLLLLLSLFAVCASCRRDFVAPSVITSEVTNRKSQPAGTILASSIFALAREIKTLSMSAPTTLRCGAFSDQPERRCLAIAKVRSPLLQPMSQMLKLCFEL